MRALVHRPRPDAEGGFTLLEVIGVVAIIAILSAVALPSFFRSVRKGNAQAEVAAMFAELSGREDQYKLANGGYLAAPACPAVTTPKATRASTCLGSTSAWTTMSVSPPMSTLICSYQISAGSAAATATVPTGFTFTQPPTSWYYILATCDGDGSATLNARYFTSSGDGSTQSQDEGN